MLDTATQENGRDWMLGPALRPPKDDNQMAKATMPARMRRGTTVAERHGLARKETGTKVKLFPQPPFLKKFKEPETVWISPPAGSVAPGPADDRMYVVQPIGKRRSYGLQLGPYGIPYLYLPPWQGSRFPGARPNASGHFDHLQVGTREFEAAHLYGVVRFVLDAWEDYFSRPIEWHFRQSYDRLELTTLPLLNNAQVGYGFLEAGSDTTDAGEVRPFSLSFDVLAHEVGHLIIYAEVGLPAPEAASAEYFGFHESAADLVALVSVLHFDSVVDDLLQSTSGNLYTLNELNRIAELSETEQIRLASNPLKLSDFSMGWADEHDLAQPLTGAMFDILVDVFHENLLELGLISPYVEDLADFVQRDPRYEGLVQTLFDEAYEANHKRFKQALLAARDYLGVALALTWSRLSPHHLDYEDVALALLEVDYELTGGRYRRLIRNSFLWREIGSARVGPRLVSPGSKSHAFSARTVTAEHEPYLAKLTYFERVALSRR